MFGELEKTVKSFAEPFISGFHPAALAAELDAVGLKLEADQSEFQLVQRYDPQDVNVFKPADRNHVARVRVRGVTAR